MAYQHDIGSIDFHWTILFYFFVNFQYSGTNFFYDLRMSFLASITPLALLYIYFHIGQEIHSNSLDLNYVVYQTEWYRYPCKVQRYLNFMILRSQQPFYLSAYGIMKLNSENYVGVGERIEKNKQKLFHP